MSDWNWRPSASMCPVCGWRLECRTDTDESRILESEERCPTCRDYSSEYAYGNTEERYGFVHFYMGWSDDAPDQSAERKAACEEMKKVREHSEWPSIRESPMWVAADWLADHGFTIQEAELRARLANEAKWQENNTTHTRNES